MTCAEIRILLNDYVDGEAMPEVAASIREHMASCAACAVELASLQALRTETTTLPRDIEPDTELWGGIESRLEERAGANTRTRSSRVFRFSRLAAPAWIGVGAAAAVLLIVGVREFRPRGVTAGWDVTTIEGAPMIGTRDVSGKATLREGEWLETDATSRARVDVANIGHVTVGPASAIRLKGSSDKEHRIELARGEVSAFIWAPPRLFFVDTPSGIAEDLGCQYHLVVDAEGNGSLEVTLGFVSFERDGREVIVPAGARCELRAKVGPGTPHEAEASAELVDALTRADFDSTSAGSVDAVLAASTKHDAVTLWHLIPRVDASERARVVDRLAAYFPLPQQTTRDGVLALDERMLQRWWVELYPSWSHWN